MRSIIYRRLVQQNKVLITTTPPYIKAAVSITCGFDTRKQLNGFQDIFFSK